ncbi:hypothetical protein [Actinomadura sp. NEAU-AAG7]|uniref:hypothetical protein n=1 Tax=Actinomadura sp. NEAU-AAG7 TaxID=2839640 RepID=UPI001BE4DE46|nr:hypothetical protein [Actinomadura sp. NEAU-AAG7]MBT2206857.1 hypothetical protein [Actinomadura sp. NEAU-AAG7]
MHPDTFFGYSDDDERYLDMALLRQLRRGPLENRDDVGVAHGLARLTYETFKSAYGTTRWWLENDEIREILRTLRVVLRRIGIPFQTDFRDRDGYFDLCDDRSIGERSLTAHIKARDAYLRGIFEPILIRLEEIEDGPDGAIRGVDGEVKNILFASNGSKPRIVLRDLIENKIEVVEGDEDILTYDRHLGSEGMRWSDLTGWWRERESFEESVSVTEVGGALYKRLFASLASDAEKLLFQTYVKYFPPTEPDADFPALLPQVYLHYDPYTRRQRRKEGVGDVLERERMDFLMLLPGGVRVVIEVDGKHHYAEDETASPLRYSDMVAEDRELRLYGYEVYRFGGYELTQDEGTARVMVRQFFAELLERHGVMGDGGATW